MKEHLPLMSFLGLISVSAFLAYSSLSHPIDPRMVDEAVEHNPFPAAAAMPRESMRDALTSSPMPVGPAGYKMSPTPQAAPAAQRMPPGERKVPVNGVMAKMLASPASFLMRRTTLRSAKDLRKFLADKKAVDSYLDSAPVRMAMRHPAVAKSILTNGALVRAFLATPAMSDPDAVRRLVKSPLMKKLLDCPGVQGALADPAVMTRLGADPKTAEFVAANPQVLGAISAAAPALAEAF